MSRVGRVRQQTHNDFRKKVTSSKQISINLDISVVYKNTEKTKIKQLNKRFLIISSKVMTFDFLTENQSAFANAPYLPENSLSFRPPFEREAQAVTQPENCSIQMGYGGKGGTDDNVA